MDNDNIMNKGEPIDGKGEVEKADPAETETAAETVPTDEETAAESDAACDGGSDPPAAEKPPKKKKQRRGVPVWVLVFSIFLAALITFQATYVTLTGKYGRELNQFRAQRSTVSQTLGKVYTLVDEISSMFESKYIYELDYDEMIENVLYDYVYETNDRYARYYTAEEWEDELQTSAGNSAGIGVLIVPLVSENSDIIEGGIYITRVMKDGPSFDSGIRKGDIIVAIDGRSIIGMKYNTALSLAAGESGSKVKITVMRDGEKLEFTVIRGSYTYETVEYRVIEKDGAKIGYINITEFYEITVDQFKEAVEYLKAEGCKGLIFDLRDNPGGFLFAVYYMLDYILPSGPVVKLTYADGSEETLTSDWRCISGMEMAVVVNEDTGSAAELFTAALKDYNYATIIGTTTYGKGCGQEIFELSNGGYLKLTTFLYSPPYSGNYDGVGVVPDIRVELSGDAANKSFRILTEEEDVQLAAAIENVSNKIKR